jgi:putative transposase
MLRAQGREREGRQTHPTAGALESQSVTTTHGPGVRSYDAGTPVKGRKHPILVETLGLLLVVVVTAASVSDPNGARLLFKRLTGSCNKLRLIWVDGTSRGRLLEWVILHCRFRLRPVLRSDGPKGFVLLPRRWVVERTVAWITHCRRFGKDSETQPETSEALIALAMTRLMLRRVARSEPFQTGSCARDSLSA